MRGAPYSWLPCSKILTASISPVSRITIRYVASVHSAAKCGGTSERASDREDSMTARVVTPSEDSGACGGANIRSRRLPTVIRDDPRRDTDDE